NTFALVYLMTHGGPDRATEMPLTYLYERGFTDYRFGDASAVGMVNLVVALLLSGVAAFIYRKDPTGVRR
ncbi:MAG: sugar ABC transporter permease, partial [bacterium]